MDLDTNLKEREGNTKLYFFTSYYTKNSQSNIFEVHPPIKTFNRYSGKMRAAIYKKETYQLTIFGNYRILKLILVILKEFLNFIIFYYTRCVVRYSKKLYGQSKNS